MLGVHPALFCVSRRPKVKSGSGKKLHGLCIEPPSENAYFVTIRIVHFECHRVEGDCNVIQKSSADFDTLLHRNDYGVCNNVTGSNSASG